MSSWMAKTSAVDPEYFSLQTQLSVFASEVDGGARGFQLAGISNQATHVVGGQAAVFNLARTLRGFQFGLINWVDDLEGAQLGLINVVRNGRFPVLPLFNFGTRTPEEPPSSP